MRRAARRPAGELLPRAGRRRRGPLGGHDRGDLGGRPEPGTARVRRGGRPAVRFLHAGPDRLRDRAARRRAAPQPRADPRGDERQSVPLRRLPQDRARRAARGGGERGAMKQIRKGKVILEGFEFTITAVYDEEDDWLPVWDADAELAIVGNPVPRTDGPKRVSGAARFTVDVQ